MKGFSVFVVVSALLVLAGGCERTDKAIDTLNKARALKEDMDKKAKEIEEKGQGFATDAAKKFLDNKGMKAEDKEKEDTKETDKNK